MNKKLKLWIFCIVLCGLVGLLAPPSAAVTVLWQAANTDIYLGLPFNDLEFENPLTGTEMVKEYAVLQWRDADYAAGPPPWYDDWAVSDPLNIAGNINEIWMDSRGQSIWTTTTVASNVISIHLVGDNNDGLADVFVDGVLVAKLYMYTPALSSQTALIIVKDLANVTHSVTVRDQGASSSGPDAADDVATMGAAALEKRIKWKQPPVPAHPNNVFYGWNEPSDYNGHHIVADDWVCNTDDPVTDIHWWGSYQGWKVGTHPLVMPSSFHITFWTDVPASGSDDFSHPGVVVHEIECFNFTSKFVGWDYDPRTESYEACFRFDQILTEAEYFFQKQNPPGEPPNIYWISIAAKYPSTVNVEHPWGWKVRPHDSSMAPDDAVRIFDPTAPHVNDQYKQGEPIEYPAGKSWDMAFELTARPIVPYAKWSQPPKKQSPTAPCYWGWDESSIYGNMPTSMRQIVADDWVCETKDPVKDIHWWGSYIRWTDDIPPHDAPDQFHIGVWTDVPPGSIDNFSHPGRMIKEWVVDRSELNEIYAGCDEHPLIPVPPGRETCFYYEYKIPEGQWFYQEPNPDGTPNIYWLSISAMYTGVIDVQNPWGWKTRERDRDSKAPDDAVRIFDPTTPDLIANNRYIAGEPIWWPEPENSWDTAFELTSTRYGDVYVKWSQPPVKYDPPDAIKGWDELSVYGDKQIVADDWFCDTDDPVSDIHWWGSFIGWSDKGQPPEIPDAFHIAIWTDIPAGPLGNFSHPGRVIWEHTCKEFTVEFAGWDFDPRQSSPGADPPRAPDACFRFDQDIPMDKWFRQEPGGNIYWVSIAAMYPDDTIPQYPWGWKVRPRNPESPAPDDAVRIFDPCAPILYSPYINGMPIYWPTAQDSWDTCFALTTKPEPPKKPTKHLKWSQPPIEIDPLRSRIPIYCGWDEESHNQDIVGAIGPWKIVADDFRCLGAMPITSIHWWGSYVNWMGIDPPSFLPESWIISFWSNVPADPAGDPGYSYPEKLLHQIKIDSSRVDIEYVGNDQFIERPPDSCFQYYVKLDEDRKEFFWQRDFIRDTKDNVFWISIVAEFPDDTYPWGWKTRPWHWMDDAVTFSMSDHPNPGFRHPDPFMFQITPIEDSMVCGFPQSYDMSFELDTDPRWIKWEQPFTSLRHWPHYEDEESMATEITTTEVVTKWAQAPDLSDLGVDVDATFDMIAAYPPQLLADDFECKTTEPITGIHIYGSWWGDRLPTGQDGTQDATQVQFTLSFHTDLPVGDPLNPNPWSMPGETKWLRTFGPGQFSVMPMPAEPESYYMPCIDQFWPHDHQMVYKYSFNIDPANAFLQEGTADNPVIYWLDVQARLIGPTHEPEVRFGWKTSIEHNIDDAVWIVGQEDIPVPGNWRELRYPPEHPLSPESIDLAFELTAERVTTEFTLRRLVADDWECRRKTPVTAMVWWGSYIGYGYEACKCPPLSSAAKPQKPDYFLLQIWDDIPASAAGVPFSHPNEPIWKFKADKYDQVLVGFDKHPHGEPNEPVFRYSVKLPREAWFFQEDVNNIYWLSVVAVYNDQPRYPWGWTNHPHVFNDDAVAGILNDPGPAPADWTWKELHDQTGKSEDMSFVLFTDPDPILGTCWDAVECAGQPQGDATCNGMVNLGDLLALKAAWGTSAPWTPPFCCADFNQSGAVNLGDLLILKAGWGSGPHIPSTNSQSCP